MTNEIQQFIDYANSLECGPSDPAAIIADDKIHAHHITGHPAGTLKGSHCLRIDPDGFSVGWVRNHKEGITHKFTVSQRETKTPAEKAAHRQSVANARADAEARLAEQSADAATRAQDRWDAASETGEHPYLSRKKIPLSGARISGEALIIPVKIAGRITSLQSIYPSGDKSFTKGGQVAGGYFSLAKPSDPLDRIIIAEGFSTAATIRAALGCVVVCAFNAGNLKSVAVTVRYRHPKAEIIIGADNDQWTRRQNGTPWNPGIESAQAAAIAIGGARVIAPDVPEDDPSRRTDWNDMGQDAVIAAFAAPVPDNTPPETAWYDDAPDYDQEPVLVEDENPIDAINPLGHNDGIYYFYPVESGQIVALTASSMGSMTSLYRLASHHWWRSKYPATVQDRQIPAMAAAELMALCHRRGIYHPESTRGVGVWIDNDAVTVNTGDRVISAGKSYNPAQFRGEFVYESGPRVMSLSNHPLRNGESSRLRDICRSLSWKDQMYADILAGWLVIAPVGGALAWRPHIHLTGESGSGKSTVMNNIIRVMMSQIGIIREGGTTEAAVRKAIGRSSRPYILDEAESEGMRAKINMQSILTLARVASSGGMIENANERFMARSAFCFSSINPAIQQSADESRVTMLCLEKDTRADYKSRYDALISDIRATITKDYASRMITRTVENMDALLANIATYTDAATVHFGSAREGDQLGPLIAGSFSLTSTRRVTHHEATAWISSQNWGWKESSSAGSEDSQRCLMHITSARIQYDIDGQNRSSTIADLIEMAAGSGTHADTAARALRNIGIDVRDGAVRIANKSPRLSDILKDTPWVVWKTCLSRYPSATSTPPIQFATAFKQRAISIPLSAIISAHDETDITTEDFL